MSAVKVFLLIFVFIETMNMLELYFLRDNSLFNGVSVFCAWEESKKHPDIHEFLVYLVNWLAGVKVLVVGLVLVMVFTASETALTITAVVMVLGIITFYWRMYPAIRRFDVCGRLVPKGRSIALGLMVGGLAAGLLTSIFF